MKTSVPVLRIEKTKIFEFEIDRLDRFVGAEAFVGLARVDEIFQFHLVERAPLPDFAALAFTAIQRPPS
jgi:hypothetical protein